MIHAHRTCIFWLVYATTFLPLIAVAKLNVTSDQDFAFLKASKCIFLQQPVYDCAKGEAHFPPPVAALLEDLPQNIRDGIVNGSFKAQTVEDLVKISPSLLNLIPTRQIHFSAGDVSAYLHNHSRESALAVKLISCLNSSLERKSFLENWNGDESNSKLEDIVASALTRWQRDTDWNFLGLVQSSTTILFRVPPQFLLSFNSKEASEFLFHLGSKFNSLAHDEIARVFKDLDLQNLKFLRRAWAALAVRELPDKISWAKYSFVMPGLTLDELKNLEMNDDLEPFLSYDFSPSQIRTIISRTVIPWQLKLDQVAAWVKYLSPAQIQTLWQLNLKFSRQKDLGRIKDKDLRADVNQTASYATAKQILLYQLYNIDEENIKEGKYLNLSKSEDLLKLGSGFVSILPLKMIRDLSNLSVLTLESLQKIDSNLISLSAAYYLTDESQVFNLIKPTPKLTGVRGMLKAIPTSKIMAVGSEDVSSVILHHLLQHLQGDNILRNVELLRKCRPTLGNPDYILKFLLENKDKNDYFRLLSLKDVARISLKTINSLTRDNYGQRVKELPHHILAAILSSNSPGSWTWNNMLNSSDAFDSLLMGLNCNELRKIEDSDFIAIMARYNDNRLKMSKVFPKNLQRCGQLALSDYLLLKSNLYNEPELLDLLEPSDIEAVGGYILVSLSAEEILHAKYSKKIISAIGQLSLPELMLAASREHLSSLTDEYLNKAVKISDLLLLRNLIHFISAANLAKLGPNDVKYVIESDMIDKRLCADMETRRAWAKLLISIYGLPSKWNASQLESVGDLMISLSPDQLDSINSSQWQLLADIAVTRYTEFIEWQKTATFHQACQSTLIKSEQKSYLEAVKSLQRKYFIEVQKLVGSIKLNVNDSMVLLKTGTTGNSFKSLPKPIVIKPEDLEEEEDLNPEDSEESKLESAESEEAFETPITEKSTTPDSNRMTSPHESDKPSSVSARNFSPKLRNGHYSQSSEVDVEPNSLENEDSGEKLSSLDDPEMTEISSVIPDENKRTTIASVTEKKVLWEISSTAESSSSSDFTETPVHHLTADQESLIDGAIKTGSQEIYLPENPFSQSEEDDEDDDVRPKIFGPEVIKDEIHLTKNPFSREEEDDDVNERPQVFGPDDSAESKSSESEVKNAEIRRPNYAVETDNVADASDQLAVSTRTESKESSKEEVTEKVGGSTVSSSSAPRERNLANVDEEIIDIELSVKERVAVKETHVEVEEAIPREQVSSSAPGPVDLPNSDIVGESSSDYLREGVPGFKSKTASVPDLSSSTEAVTDSNVFSSTTTTPGELPNLEKVGETFGDFLFGSFRNFRRKTTTAANLPSTTEQTTDSNDFSSTTTEIPSIHEIGDKVGAIFFGDEVAKEGKKLREGFLNLFIGGNEAEESPMSSTTPSPSGINSGLGFLGELMKPNEDITKLFSVQNDSERQESSTESTTLISTTAENVGLDDLRTTIKPNEDGGKLFSTQKDNGTQKSSNDSTTTIRITSISTDAFEPSTTLHQENPTASPNIKNLPEQITVIVSTSSAPSARSQESKSEEVVPRFDFYDFIEPETSNLTFLDSLLSDMADMDYKQPQAEVFDGKGGNNDASGADDYSGHTVDVEFPSEYFPSHVAKRKILSIPSGSASDFKQARVFRSKRRSDQSLDRNRRNADSTSNNVFCDSVKVLGQSVELALEESDLHSVNNDELLNCVEDLGKLDLPKPLKEIIWQRVKSAGVLNMAVGNLAAVWRMDDVSNLRVNISEDWNLEVIYLLSKYNLDNSVSKIIVEKMKKQIFTNEMSEVSEAVMVAMGPLLCYLDIKELQLMFRTPGTFMHVIPIIGEMMQECRMECLSKFAKLAVAFMDPADSWTSDIVALLGPIPAGLDAENWKLLTGGPRAISGLQPKALECLPQSLLQMMSPETMSILPPLTTKVLTDKQLSLLDKAQKDVLMDIKYEHWSLRNMSTVQKSNEEETTKVNVEVDLSASCNVVTPSIIITVFSLALLLS